MLERDLATAKSIAGQAMKALQRKHQGDEWEAYVAACAEEKRLQRELALAKGQEAAMPYEWEPAWDSGAPMPHIMATDQRTLFMYYASTPDPNWDGSYVNVVEPSAPTAMPLAIVEIEGCYAHKFGGPNDEVFDGHSLSERGLDGYGAYTVENSKWLAELQSINSVHSMYRVESWKAYKHFFLAFHDSVMECIATGFAIECIDVSFSEAAALMMKKLLG